MVLKRGAEHIRRAPSEYLRQIWLDTVSPLAMSIRYGYDFVGPDRLLYASDHPWVDPKLIAGTCTAAVSGGGREQDFQRQRAPPVPAMTLSRRALLVGAAGLHAAPRPLRFGICNETFGDRSLCRGVPGGEDRGIHGHRDRAAHAEGARRALRKIMRDEGLTFIGLHSLLFGPSRTAHHHVRRCRAQTELGSSDQTGGRLFIARLQRRDGAGIGKQRSAWSGGSSIAEASKRLEEGLAALAPIAHARGVTVLWSRWRRAIRTS